MDIMENNPKKGKTGLIIGILIVVILIGVGVFFYIRNNDPMYLTSKSFTLMQNKMEGLKSNPEYAIDMANGYSLAGNMKFEVTANDLLLQSDDGSISGIVSLLNALELNYDIRAKNSEYLIDFNTKIQSQDFVGSTVYFNNNTLYVKLKNIYDKFISIDIPTEETVTAETLSDEDAEYLYEFVTNSFVKNINKDDIKKIDGTIKLNGQSTKVTKNTIEFDFDGIKTLFGKIDSDIKADTRANKVASIIGLSFNVDDAEESEEKLYYTTYTLGLLNTVVGSELGVEEEGTLITIGFIDNTNPTFEIREDGEVLLAITVKKSGDVYTYTVTDASYEEIGTLTYNEKSKELSMDFAYEIEDMGVEMNFKTVKDGNKTTATGEIVLLSMGMDLFTIKLTEESTKTDGAEITIDTSNSVKFEDLTEADIANIQQKLMSLLQ